MSSTTILIKRKNHRVHPCKNDKKEELLNLLIGRNPELSILIVTQNDPEAIQNVQKTDNITIMSDAALADSKELQCDILISIDLPDTAAAYMQRLSHAKKEALILIDAQEQKKLYPIETAMGRTIQEEIISGFETDELLALQREKEYKEQGKELRASGQLDDRNACDNRRKPRNNKKPRDDKRPARKPYSKPKPSQESSKESAPKRAPRKFKVKSLKTSKKSE